MTDALIWLVEQGALVICGGLIGYLVFLNRRLTDQESLTEKLKPRNDGTTPILDRVVADVREQRTYVDGELRLLRQGHAAVERRIEGKIDTLTESVDGLRADGEQARQRMYRTIEGYTTAQEATTKAQQGTTQRLDRLIGILEGSGVLTSGQTNGGGRVRRALGLGE